MTEDIKLQRQQYLQSVLEKYTTTEPVLSLKDIAEVIVWQVGDISSFVKEVKKELKK